MHPRRSARPPTGVSASPPTGRASGSGAAPPEWLVQSPKLKAAFEKHLAETEGQIERLDSIDETPKGKTCDAILGLIDESKEVMDEYKGMPALDAGLAASAQAVEHYEISRYGTLKTWASELGLPDAAALLDATLKEEKATDLALTALAKSVVNVEAEADI